MSYAWGKNKTWNSETVKKQWKEYLNIFMAFLSAVQPVAPLPTSFPKEGPLNSGNDFF